MFISIGILFLLLSSLFVFNMFLTSICFWAPKKKIEWQKDCLISWFWFKTKSQFEMPILMFAIFHAQCLIPNSQSVSTQYSTWECMHKAFLLIEIGASYFFLLPQTDLCIYFCYIINTLDMVVIRVEFWRQKKNSQIKLLFLYLFMQDNGISIVGMRFVFLLPLFYTRNVTMPKSNRFQ